MTIPCLQTRPVSAPEASFDRALNKLQKLHLPADIATAIARDDTCRSFFVDSKLIFIIATYANSTALSGIDHAIRLINGEPAILVRGEFMPWSQLRGLIRYDATNNEPFVSANDPTQPWNYISPDGFVPRGTFEYQQVYPTEHLTPVAFGELMQHASRHPLAAPGRDCIMQVVTTQKMGSWGVPKCPMSKNVYTNFVSHVHLRVITPDGNLYSFGLGTKNSNLTNITQSLPWRLAATTISNIQTPDFEESRPFEECYVTSVPITGTSAQAILDRVSSINSTGLRCSLGRQNCSTLAAHLMSLGDVTVEARQPFYVWVGRLMPSVEDCPAIGPIIARVAAVAGLVLATIAQVIPAPMRHAWNAALSATVHKVATLLSNLVILALGGWYEAVPCTDETAHVQRFGLEQFNRLINSFPDLLSEELSMIATSQPITDWQRAQATTVVHAYTEPKLYI